MNTSVYDFLAARRSLKPDKLSGPGPTAEEMTRILTAGSRVPDHKKLAPWRFIVFEGAARTKAGEIFAEACRKEEKELPSEVRLDMERGRFLRAPTVVAVVSSLRTERPVPEWEQILSAGALCYNTCLAANALGFGTSWITEWISYSPFVKSALGLSDQERIAGFLYLGRASEKPDERERPALDQIVMRWQG